MQFWKAMKNNIIADGAKAFSVILLLISYTVENTRIEGIHQLFHSHDDSVAHSAQQEKKPCHRSIYHYENRDGCEHKSHLITDTKCNLCHLLLHNNDQVVVSDSSCEFIPSCSIIAESLISVQLADIDIHLPSRAPPFI